MAGGLSSAYSADLGVVKGAGNSLKSTKKSIDDGKACSDATGASDYHDITSAISTYQDKWENALTRLAKSIGDLGDRVTDAASAYESNDTEWSGVFKKQMGQK